MPLNIAINIYELESMCVLRYVLLGYDCMMNITTTTTHNRWTRSAIIASFLLDMKTDGGCELTA